MCAIEPVGTRSSHWGEGPIWWNGALWYVDLNDHAVCRFDPASGAEHAWDVGEPVGTMVPRARGGWVLAGESGFRFFDPESGATRPIHDPEPGLADNRFNDGKCSPDGRFFAGTMSRARQPHARLYRLDPDLTCHPAFGPVTTSNGIVWSADGRTVWYIDTPRREVLAFDYVHGRLTNPRSAFPTGHLDASPDGMAIDAADHLWIAFCHGGCVACFEPATGRELARLALPCMETTACAFGGPGLTDLFVTTGVNPARDEPLAGRLFVVRGLGVRGVAANPFAG
jgi:sugar lactone lactonase YvrE